VRGQRGSSRAAGVGERGRDDRRGEYQIPIPELKCSQSQCISASPLPPKAEGVLASFTTLTSSSTSDSGAPSLTPRRPPLSRAARCRQKHISPFPLPKSYCSKIFAYTVNLPMDSPQYLSAVLKNMPPPHPHSLPTTAELRRAGTDWRSSGGGLQRAAPAGFATMHRAEHLVRVTWPKPRARARRL
jgi:hypothetical protein